MKHKKAPKPTPEESLRHTCEEGMGLDLNYSEIRDRLDTAEIARVGKVRQTAAKTPATAPAPRRAVPAILLVLAVLILTPALAVGSFLIARSTMDSNIPKETVNPIPPFGTNPDQSFTPSDPTVMIPRPIAPNTSGEKWGNVFNLSESYATDTALFLRAEHLNSALTEGTLPAVLTVSDAEEWKSFYGDVYTEDIPGQGLLDGLNGLTWEFFQNHSLQVIITEGRSGSIRYSLEETFIPLGKVHRSWELVAQVPLALTMDIVHWCIVIPVSKAEAEIPVLLSMREVHEIEPGNPNIPDTVITPDSDLLWFEYASYARNGCLYGRIGYNPDGTYPRTRSVSTLAEWQILYQSCSEVSDQGFAEGLTALDEAFFTEQSLLILYVEEGSGSYRHRVDEVAVEDGTVTVTLVTLKPEIYTCDMAYWAILIPIDKGSAELPVEIAERQETMTDADGFETAPPRVCVCRGYLNGDTVYGDIYNEEDIDYCSFPFGRTVDSVTAYQAAIWLLDDPKVPTEFRREMNSFDEAFFAEKSLLILYVSVKNDPYEVHYEVFPPTVQSGSLIVGIHNPYPEDGDPGDPYPHYWVILVPIDKEFANLPVDVRTFE